MRFGLAIASLVLAGILLILGIGQRTFLAGPREIVYPVSLPASVEYAVIPAAELEAVPGQANIEVRGSNGFAATGSSIDVEAWVAPSDHVVVAADTEAKELTGSLVAAQQSESEEDEAKPEDSDAAEPAEGSSAEDVAEDAAETEAFDPRGSDLWLETQDGAGRMPVSAVANQSLIVQVPAGDKVSVVWVQDLRTPFAGPLMVAGGIFALLGLVLYLLAVDHDRRGLGPRRGRKGPLPGIRGWLGGGGKREKSGKETARSRPASAERRALRPLAVPALGLTAVIALSGCSASYWPDFSQQEASDTEQVETSGSNLAPVPVTQAQIDRIITDVVNIAAESDDALDAETLEARFAGDALTQRAANYKIRSSVSDYEVTLPRITDEHLGYELVQSTEGWPRTLFVTVASEIPGAQEAEGDGADDSGEASGEEATQEAPPASPSLALVLTQPNPHENYRVERLFALRGGIKMPTAAPVEEGTALLADDLQTLALPPGEVGAAYAEILTGGTESEHAELFAIEGDTMIAKSGAAWVAAAKQAASEAGTDVAYSVTAEQGPAPVVSLSTGVGGALVATTVLENRVEKQAGDYQPKAVGAFEALSGLSGRQEQMVSVVAHQLLFFVPSATSGEKIQLLGFTTELVEAKN